MWVINRRGSPVRQIDLPPPGQPPPHAEAELEAIDKEPAAPVDKLARKTRDRVDPRPKSAARKRILAACPSRAAGRATHRLICDAKGSSGWSCTSSDNHEDRTAGRTGRVKRARPLLNAASQLARYAWRRLSARSWSRSAARPDRRGRPSDQRISPPRARRRAHIDASSDARHAGYPDQWSSRLLRSVGPATVTRAAEHYRGLHRYDLHKDGRLLPSLATRTVRQICHTCFYWKKVSNCCKSERVNMRTLYIYDRFFKSNDS